MPQFDFYTFSQQVVLTVMFYIFIYFFFLKFFITSFTKVNKIREKLYKNVYSFNVLSNNSNLYKTKINSILK